MDANTREKRDALNVTREFPLVSGVMILMMLLAFSCGRGDEKGQQEEVVRPAKLMTVSPVIDAQPQELPGRVRASRRADLAFQVSGPLTDLPFEEGAPVKKGDVVARILPRDFKTALDTAKANELEAMNQYQRFKELYIKKQVSKADFDKAKRTYDVARSNVTNAENALKDTYLRAPFSGVIARRYVENFQEVRAKDPIVSLQDVSELEIVVDVPETMMAPVRNRASGEIVAQVEFSALPGIKHDLRLKEFSTEADPQTQTYRVVLALPAPKDANILPGMTAKVTGKRLPSRDMPQKGVYIPVNAVIADEAGNQFVWVVDAEKMTAEKRQVTVGNVSGSSISILEGIKPGEKIVIAGVHYLRPGMKIRELRSK